MSSLSAGSVEPAVSKPIKQEMLELDDLPPELLEKHKDYILKQVHCCAVVLLLIGTSMLGSDLFLLNNVELCGDWCHSCCRAFPKLQCPLLNVTLILSYC